MSNEHWIKRNVTVIDWPWIPDAKVKDLISDYFSNSDYGKNAIVPLENIVESLQERWDEDEDEESPDNENIALIENFMEKYNLPDDTRVKFWW